MSTDSKSDASAAVAAAIAEWFEAIKTGVTPDREAFLNRFPMIRSEIAQVLDSFENVQSGIATSTHKKSSKPHLPKDDSPQASMVTAVSVGETNISIDSVSTNARFRELKQFNKGGLGNLFRAYDESLNRETAVKMVNDVAAAEPTLITQFRIEAEITGRLDHPGVVPVYGFGEDWDGRPFYVMRLVKGRELTQAIKDYHQLREKHPNGAETRRQLMTLLEQLISACKTIAYAHDVGIIHCDIKPANIMVGKYGEVFVLDWGLAATFDHATLFTQRSFVRPRSSFESSTSGPRGGTYGYIAPEQLVAELQISPTNDVYSLGATLYEILTGKPPFNGRDVDVVTKIRDGKFAYPRTVVRTVPSRLEAICLKAMKRDPQDRYETATLLARDLTAWMRDDELLAVPDRWFNRISRITRRHKAVTVTFILCSLVMGATAIWNAYETEKHRYVQQQNALVQQSLDTSLKTLEDLCRPLANGEMHDLTVLMPSMHRINEFTSNYLQKYESLNAMRLHTGRVYELRATLSRILSPDPNKVLAYYQQAEDLYESQAKAMHDENHKTEIERRLVDVKMNRGAVLIQREEYDKAEETLLQARVLSETLNHRNRMDQGLERDLASVYHLLGQVYLEREVELQKNVQRLEVSKAFFEDSANLLNKLLRTADGIEKLELQRDLARSHGYLGDLYLAQGHISKSERCYKDSDELRRLLYDLNHQDAEYRFQYARGLGNFGYLERCYRGDLKAAVDHLTKTLELQRGLVEDFPELKAFAVELAYTENSLAEITAWLALDLPENKTEGVQTKSEVLKQARHMAASAIQHLSNSPESKADLASSKTTLAIIASLEHPETTEAKQLATEARDLLKNSSSGGRLTRGELVTMALASSILGETQAAYDTLNDAVNRGENTGMRFKRHGRAGFQNLANDPKLGDLYRSLCEKVLSDLKDN